MFTLLEMLDQPPNRHAGIDQDVEESQSYAPDPSQDQAQQYAVDAPMDPRGRVRESEFVNGHPFILEQPIRSQVKHKRRFEGGQGHGGLTMTVTYPQADSCPTERNPFEQGAVSPAPS